MNDGNQQYKGKKIIIGLFKLIKQDSRHHNVSLIYKKPIEERYFSNWTMGFSKVSYEDLKTIEGFSDFLHRPTPESYRFSHNEVDELFSVHDKN